MTALEQNRLMTPELEQALSDSPLYSQDDKQKDAVCHAIFSIGNVRWYVLEGEKESDDFTMYGIVAGLQATEYGYMSLNEMAGVTLDARSYGLGIMTVEQDKEFEPCKLADIQDGELQRFLSEMYD